MKTKYWILLLSALLLVCGIGGAFLLAPGEASSHAQIVSDGRVLHTVDLRFDREIQITTDIGSNTVTVKDGKIAVTQADCPDHYCMERGYCAGGTPIVCLPNKLVISFLEDQEVDGIVG